MTETATPRPPAPPRRPCSSPGWAGVALLGVAAALTVAMWPMHAFADAPQVTTPAGPFTDGQTITVSGSGFPDPHADPTGLQILQCADPGGTVANLPSDPSTCDGTTVNPLPVNTDAGGRFSDPYAVALLTGVHGTSNIECDATHFCVLWVGVDYNQAFSSGPHAFSKAFEIEPASTGPTSTVTTTSPSVGASSPTTAPGNATPAAATAGAGTTPGDGGASLASTGVPASLPWVVAGGLALTLFGGLGRRLAGRGLPDRGI